jgi:hypothetical protein
MGASPGTAAAATPDVPTAALLGLGAGAEPLPGRILVKTEGGMTVLGKANADRCCWCCAGVVVGCDDTTAVFAGGCVVVTLVDD